MENKIALVLGGGGLRGAYGAGVAAGLDMQFDAYYGSSVGVFATTFHLAGQRDTIENTWINHVDGTKLVNLKNSPRKNGKHKLNLDYLLGTFQNHVSHLDLDMIFDEKGFQRKRLIYALTDVRTGKPIYISPNRDNIFHYMKGSAALPLVNEPQLVEGNFVMDGGISDGLPVKKAIEDGYGEVVSVVNKPRTFDDGIVSNCLWYIAGWLHSKPIRQAMHAHKKQVEETEAYLAHNTKQIHIIRPSAPLPLRSKLDTNRDRLIETFEIGRQDAKNFLRTFKSRAPN